MTSPESTDQPVPESDAAVAADSVSQDTPESFDPDQLRPHGPGADTQPVGSLGLLNDVDMDVTVELGRTTMPIRELLALQPGMVVEIDRNAGSPIDVLVNGRLIARGEVVVIDEEFGVRLTEIASSQDVA